MKINEDELDNPVWNALTDVHTNHAIDYGNVKFYHPEYAPFGAYINNQDTSEAIQKHAKLIDTFFVVANEPKLPPNFKPAVKYVGLQMIIYNKINHPIEEQIIEINKTHYNQLIELVKLVYPEYFKPKTNSLGTYYGIFKNNKLVAVTGERFQTKNFIEISAVITHPDHTGKGYAKQLITYTVDGIFKKNKIPFLHVDVTNTGPIALYKKMGFVVRRKLEFWKISR
ncbi:GNAT family N-acetyltransferase [Sabulilitoribacter multivorans]|uniref:GNAT family N-acetyltransferase n=1 Tax=Flaviramulus multivorans TaxID=1304750 RepID=A0ABS9II45_9FLAO|nr:GNAT family N-acetyltransferase [Flaviramulus multivorans]MCF7560211.1 GNAT family N-acetyltransferase [Flaviramulus multivorans]